MGDAAPVKGAAAARGPVHVVDQQPKGGEPGEPEQEIDRPVVEAAGKGEQPEQAEEEGQRRDDFNVDEPREWLSAAAVVAVQVRANDAGDDLVAVR